MSQGNIMSKGTGGVGNPGRRAQYWWWTVEAWRGSMDHLYDT